MLEPPPEIVDRLVHLKLAVGYGSGFHLRDDVILTCEHVLPTVSAMRTAVVRVGTVWTRLEPPGQAACDVLDYALVVARGIRAEPIELAEPYEGEDLVIVEPRPTGGYRVRPT